MIHLSREKKRASVQQLKEFLVDKAKSHTKNDDDKLKFTEILNFDKKKVGLLINERYINIPHQIASPLFSTLNAELSKKSLLDQNYSFDFILSIVKVFKNDTSETSLVEEIFTNAEEELLSQKADFFFDYSVAEDTDTAMEGDWNADDGQPLIPYRRVIVYKGNLLSEMVQTLEAVS